MRTNVQESSIANWYSGQSIRASEQAKQLLAVMVPGHEYTGRELGAMLIFDGHQWAVPGSVSRALKELRDAGKIERRELARKCRISGVLVDVHFVPVDVQRSLI